MKKENEILNHFNFDMFEIAFFQGMNHYKDMSYGQAFCCRFGIKDEDIFYEDNEDRARAEIYERHVFPNINPH